MKIIDHHLKRKIEIYKGYALKLFKVWVFLLMKYVVNVKLFDGKLVNNRIKYYFYPLKQ